MNLRRALRDNLIRAFQLYYNLIDPTIQRRGLRDYRDDVRSTSPGQRRFETARYAILVYYEPNGVMSTSVQNLLEELTRQEVNVLTVSNIPLSAEQATIIERHSWSVMIRGNQGLDFGAYKDAIRHLGALGVELDRLLLLNDSVYYFSRGLSEFVSGLLGSEDTIAAFENWDPQHAHHLQSFALSVSGFVYNHPTFSRFWRDYIPYNNRLMAIEKGEKKLSRACLKVARTTKVIYNAGDLYDVVNTDNASIPATEFYVSAPIEVREGYDGRKFLGPPKKTTSRDRSKHGELTEAHKYRLFDTMYTGSPLHTSMYYFARFARCPIIKKDIVYRKQYRFWEVEVLLRDIYDKDEMSEFLTMLRVKGNMSALPILKRAKTKVGAA